MTDINFNFAKKVAKHPLFIEGFFKKLKLKMTKTNDIWEAYQVARDQIYPTPEVDWQLISARKAVKLLNQKISLYNMLKFIKNKTFRSVNSKIYKEEVELFKVIFDLKDIFYQSGALIKTKEAISQKEVIAVIPKQINKLNKGKLDQEMSALVSLLQNDFTQEFLKKIVSIKK